MEFQEIVMQRYAVKEFDNKKVPESKINKLLEMIRYAPSSYNIQPWKIIVITDQKLKEKLAPASWNQLQIITCSHLLVLCADKDIAEKIEELEKLMIKSGSKPESIKGYIDMMNGFEKSLTDEQKLAWSQKQVYIALGNALNGAKSLGFDSCPMEGFNSEKYSEILKLPANVVPTVLAPAGFAKDFAKEKLQKKLRFSKEAVFMFK